MGTDARSRDISNHDIDYVEPEKSQYPHVKGLISPFKLISRIDTLRSFCKIATGPHSCLVNAACAPFY